MVRWLALCLCFALLACEPSANDSIAFAIASPPKVLDPRLASDAASERVNDLLFDRLIRLDADGSPQAVMADWERLDDQHFRIHLRPDRRAFANGRQPDADDVAATYRSVLDPATGSPHAGAIAHIVRIDVAGPSTVEFLLSRADPLFPTRLTLGILPVEALQQTDARRKPQGSGSFQFHHWRSDGGVRLVRRSDGQAIDLITVPDPTMRALKLLRGEAHLLQNDLPNELYGYLEAQHGVTLHQHPGTTFAYIGFNLNDPVLARHEIRAAVAHAVDRKAIVKYLFGDRAEPAETILRPEHWAARVDLRPHAYDPALARKYLAQTGFGPDRPLVISYKTSTDPFRLRIAHVLQSQLAQVGIKLEVASYDWGTFFGDVKAGRFQMYGLAWVGVNTPDILRYAFHSQSTPPGGANRGGYRSEDVDRLLSEAEAHLADTAAGLYARALAQIHEDLVYVPLWYEHNIAVSRGIRGYRPDINGSYAALEQVQMNDVR